MQYLEEINVVKRALKNAFIFSLGMILGSQILRYIRPELYNNESQPTLVVLVIMFIMFYILSFLVILLYQWIRSKFAIKE